MPSKKALLYWAPTLFICVNALIAGVMNLARLDPLFSLVQHLGYPTYFTTLLGTWKVLGAVALLAPRYPLIKEWAYAGLFIDFTAAIASHLAVGDPAFWLLGPVISLICLVVSWGQRPASRRLLE